MRHFIADVPPGLENLGHQKKPDNLAQDVKLLGHYLNRLWNQVKKLQSGDPAPHAVEHMVGGADQLVSPDDAEGLGNANDSGDDPRPGRVDHVHKRDVRVYSDNTEVATRNALDFHSFVVADESGTDQVRVDPSMLTWYYGL